MGNCCSVEGAVDHWIYVKTGDRKGAGTDANLTCILWDNLGVRSGEIKLDCYFRNDFERGRTDVFQCPPLGPEFGKVTKLEIWRDDSGFGADWFCEVIVVVDRRDEKSYYFPLHRWAEPDEHYLLTEYDTYLPQNEPYPEQRQKQIEANRIRYEYEQKIPEMPVQIREIPEDEHFSDDYKWDIMKRKTEMIGKSMWARVTKERWRTLDDVGNLYDGALFETPRSYLNKSMGDDFYFGAQRLVGCNPNQIKLCKQLPRNMAVTAEMLRHQLEGWTLEQIIASNRLFIVDHKILEDLPTKDDNPICCPLALFFMNSTHKLVPIAIQLYQDIAEDNPVFMPGDPPGTWTLAKMWFNHADASVHQALTHIAFTHLIMEGICCSMHRNMAPNHPLSRLMSPHFLFLIAVNDRGIGQLLQPGGWVDKTMSIGREGMFDLTRRGIEIWRLDVHGCLPKDLEVRGVLDQRILPNYSYRDDALLYHKAIEKYVTKIVRYYYPVNKVIHEDHELQNWAREMATPKEQGGVGILGIPGNGKLMRHDELTLLLTSIIFTCSVQHAAANFPQYHEYGYPLNYPAFLYGMPPADKLPKLPEDLLEAHPTMEQTLDVLAVTRIISQKGTRSLGDWEFQFQYDPIALKAEKAFKEELVEIGHVINKRNEERLLLYKYDYLHPNHVPNAISI